MRNSVRPCLLLLCVKIDFLFELQGLTHSSTDVRITASDVCAQLKRTPDSLLTTVVPLLLGNTQEKNTAVRAAAESAIVELMLDEESLEV